MTDFTPGQDVLIYDLHPRTRLYCWIPGTFMGARQSGRVGVLFTVDRQHYLVTTEPHRVKAAKA